MLFPLFATLLLCSSPPLSFLTTSIPGCVLQVRVITLSYDYYTKGEDSQGLTQGDAQGLSQELSQGLSQGR